MVSSSEPSSDGHDAYGGFDAPHDIFEPPPPTTTSSNSQPFIPVHGSEYNPFVGALLLSCLLLLLVTVLFLLVIYIRRHKLDQERAHHRSRRRHHHHMHHQLQHHQQHTKRKQKLSPERIQRRYRTIEGWLITKRVLAHDVTTCQSVVETSHHSDAVVGKDAQEPFVGALSRLAQDAAKVALDVLQTSGDNDDVNECPVCMEEFRVGDVVSWSPSTTNSCNHVFHHHCIKEWLLRHKHCPFCRECFLTVDNRRRRTSRRGNMHKTSQKELDEEKAEMDGFLAQHAKRGATTFYCHQDGLVTIPNNLECGSVQQWKNLRRAVVHSTVPPERLALMRGTNATLSSEADESLTPSSSQLRVDVKEEGVSITRISSVLSNNNDSSQRSSRTICTGMSRLSAAAAATAGGSRSLLHHHSNSRGSRRSLYGIDLEEGEGTAAGLYNSTDRDDILFFGDPLRALPPDNEDGVTLYLHEFEA